MNPEAKFDFGENWKNYSNDVLASNLGKLKQTKRDFIRLLGSNDLKGQSFLDIGFGQGLSLLMASSLEAFVVGFDINRKCLVVLKKNKKLFPDLEKQSIRAFEGSILDNKSIEKASKLCPNKSGKFDIVHSWGVLHHTGEMWLAIDNSCELTEVNGKLILSIYNQHWSSPTWLIVKRLYNMSPVILQKIMIFFFYWVIVLSKWLYTRSNPFSKTRGMSFFYDVVDWVGGYPYEFASKQEIQDYVEKKGFSLIKYAYPAVPTGCIEYVFKKN